MKIQYDKDFEKVMNEPVKLWEEKALELASREEELLCQCGKPMEEPYAPFCSRNCWREMFEGQGN